jgi:hypothetical protein
MQTGLKIKWRETIMDQVQRINQDEIEYQEYCRKYQKTNTPVRVKMNNMKNRQKYYGYLIWNTIVIDFGIGCFTISNDGVELLHHGSTLEVEEILTDGTIVDLAIWK